jgi:hypothetical protein
MQRYLWLCLIAALLIACGDKAKKSMTGDEAVTMEDLIAFFDELPLPYSVGDTLLSAKVKDSNRIEYKVFSRLFGDTLLPEYKKAKPKLYAVGKFRNKKAETYLLLQTRGSQNNLYALAIDEKLVPRASLLLLSNKGKAADINTVVIDKRFTFTTIDDYKTANGETAAYSTVYAYNTAGLFMVIMSDGVKKGGVTDLVNPIDTFPQRQPYSGDYAISKKHFISIRDSDTDKKFMFFLYMNKGNNCTAELKGEARWTSKDEAIYEASTDGCKVTFKFSGRTLKVTELEGCTTRRPMVCSFSASFTKKVVAKQHKKK